MPRHFHAFGLIAARCDVVAAQRALGHFTAPSHYDGPDDVTVDCNNTYSRLWQTP